MRVLFVNTQPAQCGVHQYGENLAAVLDRHPKMIVGHFAPNSEAQLREMAEQFDPDFTLYNWQALIGGWMGGAPFAGLGKQVLVYHDLHANFEGFDAILFSDPTATDHENWHMIGRPLNFPAIGVQAPAADRVIVGVNGLIGANADAAVASALHCFPGCHIRLHLPASTFCDPHAHLANAQAIGAYGRCAAHGATIQISHEYLPWPDLVRWLSGNHLNLYIRDLGHPWRGVSSVLDGALCARRPIAINRCGGFRHLFDCAPSICVEDRLLPAIVADGLAPLQPKLDAWSPERVSAQVYDILANL